MAELQSKPETALTQAAVVAEVPSNDTVVMEASGAHEAKAVDVAPESDFCSERLLGKTARRYVSIEAELKKIEEKLEKKRAQYGERMKNKMALVHKEAEEKRAVIEAKGSEEILKTEEMAAKYRATGTTLKKTMGCF
ncbi:unnamed protein product [Sphenostylis stenocarpa]|uniref:Remorin C-terminal domain-containing protein n=1 Tax=Sphenostylis stenocarpa TaxID=92480 RepID=A0AA86V5I1_9FABA|nr:unnamed protein product [Sphenostylis stenocarpa]